MKKFLPVSLLLTGLLSVAMAAQAQTTVTVVHGVPGDGLGLDVEPDLPVDVWLSGLGCAITDLRFGETFGPAEIPADVYDVEIRLRDEEAGDCGGGVAIAVPDLPLEEGENSTIVAHLDAAGVPVASKFVNELQPSPPGESFVEARHLAEAPAVDIRAYRFVPWSGFTPLIDLEGVVNGDAAGADIPYGIYVFAFSPAGGDPIAYEIVVVYPGQSIAVHAVGSLPDGTFRTIVTSQRQSEPEPDPGTTTVTVLHGITGTDLGEDPALPVDVWISGLGCAIPDFRFGEQFGPADVPAGDYDIEIRFRDEAAGDCGGELALGVDGVPLADGENSTIIAHLTADGGATASKFVNDVSGTDRYDGRLAVHHTAAAPAVDIGILKRFFFFFAYPVLELFGVENGAAASEDLRAGGYDLEIAPAGGRPIFSDHVQVRRNELVGIYAVGSLEGGTFQLLETRQPL